MGAEKVEVGCSKLKSNQREANWARKEDGLAKKEAKLAKKEAEGAQREARLVHPAPQDR